MQSPLHRLNRPPALSAVPENLEVAHKRRDTRPKSRSHRARTPAALRVIQPITQNTAPIMPIIRPTAQYLQDAQRRLQSTRRIFRSTSEIGSPGVMLLTYEAALMSPKPLLLSYRRLLLSPDLLMRSSRTARVSCGRMRESHGVFIGSLVHAV
jgi:hypothetical protein